MARRFLLTARDLTVLSFVAVQRLVLAAHVQSWMGANRVVVYRRLGGLVGAGLLSYERIFHAAPGCYRVTRGGLAVIGSDLPRPTIDLRSYDHDLAVTSLWLLAARRTFGPFKQLLTEREQRSRDGRPDRVEESFGVPVGWNADAAVPRLHHPDLLLTQSDGRMVAIELELSIKSRRRLEEILLAFSNDPRVAQVLYVTASDRVARSVSDVASTFGLGQLLATRALPKTPAHGPGSLALWLIGAPDRSARSSALPLPAKDAGGMYVA